MANLKISVLNVGHGDFIYAETPKGHSLVIDCGFDDGDVSPAKFLSKLSTIHELQISHPHTDHFSEIAALSKKTIKSFRCPALDTFKDETIGWRNKDAAAIKALRTLAKTTTSDDGAVPVGDSFEHWVFPARAIDYADPNTASYVTILRYGEFKMLFGGDLPESGWDALLKEQKFVDAIKGTNIVKVSHHGRKEGCSTALFEKITPDLCVISDKSIDKTNENTVCTTWYSQRATGVNWSDGTVRKVLTTRSDGSIHIQTAGGGFHVWGGVNWKTEDWKG
jgi:beta-lactamase superfamily II metal-dependent hydrolase